MSKNLYTFYELPNFKHLNCSILDMDNIRF